MDTEPVSTITIELAPWVVNRLKETSLARRTLADEAVRMLRYALKQMFPPRTPDEWRKVVGEEDWKELRETWIWMATSKKNLNEDVPVDVPQKLTLQLPSDLLSKLEEMAQSRQSSVSEAALYAIQYALTEVFPPRPVEELRDEVAESWRRILRAIWNRS